MLESPELRQTPPAHRGALATRARSRATRRQLRPPSAARLRDAERDHILRTPVRRSVPLLGRIPRLVNLVCDRALLAAYGESAPQIGRWPVRHAAAELRGDAVRAPTARFCVARAGGDDARRRPRAAVRVRRPACGRAAARLAARVAAPAAVTEITPTAERVAEAQATPVPERSAGGHPTSRRAPFANAQLGATEHHGRIGSAEPPSPPRVDDLARALALRSPGARPRRRTRDPARMVRASRRPRAGSALVSEVIGALDAMDSQCFRSRLTISTCCA